jgi:hypothetical protein
VVRCLHPEYQAPEEAGHLALQQTMDIDIPTPLAALP